ncbi:MAG: HU family DNA-binding protein [Prevotella sp.]|nr:HU family DNA-binding protein [Prevotella sp.]
MVLNARQNTNSKSEQYQRWYPYVRGIYAISTRALAQHIAQHGSLFTRDVVEGVLNKLSECIPELVAQGVGVKLNGIGTFYPQAQTVKYGLANKQAVRNTNPADAVKGIHVRFKPEGSYLDNLTSKAFKEKCSLTWGDFDEVTRTTRGDGTVNRTHTYTPINEYVAPTQNP